MHLVRCISNLLTYRTEYNDAADGIKQPEHQMYMYSYYFMPDRDHNCIDLYPTLI